MLCLNWWAPGAVVGMGEARIEGSVPPTPTSNHTRGWGGGTGVGSPALACSPSGHVSNLQLYRGWVSEVIFTGDRHARYRRLTKLSLLFSTNGKSWIVYFLAGRPFSSAGEHGNSLPSFHLISRDAQAAYRLVLRLLGV